MKTPSGQQPYLFFFFYRLHPLNMIGAMYQSTRAVLTKYQRRWLQQKKSVFYNSRGQSARSTCQQSQFLEGPFFLSCRQLSSHCVLSWPLGRESSSVSSSSKDISPIRLGLHLMTSFNLSSLLKGPVSKMQSHWGGLGFNP